MKDLRKDMPEMQDVDSKRLARGIVDLYMSADQDKMPEDLRSRFQNWLVDDRNQDVKDEVLMEYFDRELKMAGVSDIDSTFGYESGIGQEHEYAEH